MDVSRATLLGTPNTESVVRKGTVPHACCKPSCCATPRMAWFAGHAVPPERLPDAPAHVLSAVSAAGAGRPCEPHPASGGTLARDLQTALAATDTAPCSRHPGAHPQW